MYGCVVKGREGPGERPVVWDIEIEGAELACRAVACGPGESGMFEVVAFGCSLPPGMAMSGGVRRPVALRIGQWRESARLRSGWGIIEELREEMGSEFQLRMSIEIPLDKTGL